MNTYIVFLLVVCALVSCKEDGPLANPQLAEYSTIGDCPIDAEGELNGYAFESTALTKIKSFYPDNHFTMSLINFGPIYGQSIALSIGGRFDSLSLGMECSTLPDNRLDSIHVPNLDRGSIVTSAFLGLEGGVTSSITVIHYELDQTASGNFFVLDSLEFVNNSPETSGSKWFGRFSLNFILENNPENAEGIDYASSVDIQVPESLHFQDISFSAVTSTSHVLVNCGR